MPEGFESFESRRRPSPELSELLENPSEVFDSSVQAAERENKLVMENVAQAGEVNRRTENAELIIEKEGKSRHSTIQIAWPVDQHTAMVLQLNPISEGRGHEGSIFAYLGTYGVATKQQREWQLDPERSLSLEQLFGVSDGLRLLVKPTIDRWAIGKDKLTTELFGESARTLYMGLGFLFLGHQWMHIGFHEAGHLPDTHDENEAWLKANRVYSQRHKPRKDEIIEQKYLGLFELLKKPNWFSRTPTVGRITKYGLVSHHVGGTKIPEHWQSSATRIMREFRGVIEDANEAYTNTLGR